MAKRRNTPALSALALEAIDAWRADERNAKFDTTEDIGGCHRSSRRLAAELHNRGVPYRFRRYDPLPGWRTEMQHVIEVEGFVVDGIAQQFRPDADFPHVMPVRSFEAGFGPPIGGICERCGSSGDLAPSLDLGPLNEHRCAWVAHLMVDGDDDLRALQVVVAAAVQSGRLVVSSS